jgi:transcriptional regulator with XRE-family HTH domain
MGVIEKILEGALRQGLNQTALEKAAGLASGRISKIKRGEGIPTWGEIVELSKYAKVDLYDLAERKPPGPPGLPSEAERLLKEAEGIGLDEARLILRDARRSGLTADQIGDLLLGSSVAPSAAARPHAPPKTALQPAGEYKTPYAPEDPPRPAPKRPPTQARDGRTGKKKPGEKRGGTD